MIFEVPTEFFPPTTTPTVGLKKSSAFQRQFSTSMAQMNIALTQGASEKIAVRETVGIIKKAHLFPIKRVAFPVTAIATAVLFYKGAMPKGAV